MDPITHREELARSLGGRSPSELDEGTLLVVPSITFPSIELRKIIGIQHYEERLLFLLLLLSNPNLRIVFASSTRIEESVISYYLSFVDEPSARERLTLVTLDDPEGRSLTEKILEAPEKLEEIKAAAGEGAFMLTFNVTPLEMRLAESLGARLYGPHPDLVSLGSKTGSRRVAMEAGVPVLPGFEDIRSLEDLNDAVQKLATRGPASDAVVMKLNDGFSGQGNAILRFADLRDPIQDSPVMFCAGEESWPTFGAKIASGGAIVEEHRRVPGMHSPSVQLRILPDGRYEVVSTHDQILGGPDGQVYLGCRFPARAEYRRMIQDYGRRVAEVLSTRGVVGGFGIDFLVVPHDDGYEAFLAEINLRMGGTTHPFLMARLASGGVYDGGSGQLFVASQPRCYVASDNLKSESYVGLEPTEVLEALEEGGLAYDRATATGVLPHLLGALPDYGKVGATCIARSLEAAEDLLGAFAATLDALAERRESALR